MNTREKYAEMQEEQAREDRMSQVYSEQYQQDILNGFNRALSDAPREGYKEDKAAERKAMPVFSGVLKYFPNALKEVSKASKAGNDQHHPDKPLHWDMNKSKDEYDALVRHLIDHTVNPIDDDGQLHLAKVAWRALAGLERYLTNKL